LARPFKLEVKTYFKLAFGLWFQIIRLIIAGLCLFALNCIPKCETARSELDHKWLQEFFTGLCIVFVFINLLFLLPVGLLGGEPTLVSLVLKIFVGSCISLVFIIIKGFRVYEDLPSEETDYDE